MRFHDLRHTFATELLRQGVDVHRVQRLMRHSDVRVTTGTYSHLLVEDLRAAVDAHAPKPSVPPPAEPPLAAFLLHETGSEANQLAESFDNLRKLEAESGGRCRIRTCDPCRVNRLKVVGRPTPALSSPRNHWRCLVRRDPTFGTTWHRFSRGWVQIGSNLGAQSIFPPGVLPKRYFLFAKPPSASA